MITVLVVPTSSRLAKLDTVKGELGISGTGQDPQVGDYIDRATDLIRRFCDREFAQATYRETVAGHGGTTLLLTRTPLVSVSQVLTDGSPITDYTIEDPDAGILLRQAGWATGELVGWNIAPFFVPDRAYPNFSVDYVAGWKLPNDGSGTPVLPKDLEHAATELTKFLWRSKGADLRVQQTRVDDLSITFRDLGQTDDGLLSAAGVLAVLRRYQRWAGA